MSASQMPAAAPLISVIVPVHNGARWLGETLDSLYTQTQADFEVVLVDDASTDNLQEVLDQHADTRLRVAHLTHNVGVSAARNQGIDLARGRYIAFCDADDLCQPRRLEQQYRFLERHPEIGFCGSAFTCFDTQDRETVSHPQSDAQIRKALMSGNCFGLSTVMARTPVLKACHFDPALRLAEDYDLWTRLVASGVEAANLPESLIRYRLHPLQASRDKGEQLDQMSRQVRAFYCARLLGDEAWVQQLRGRRLDLTDLALAARRVAEHVTTHPESSTRDFRFLLAWLYQQLPSHGPLAWWQWRRVQKTLQLNLDRNYRLNISLLAFLPAAVGRRHFDTLIKLKR